MRIFWLCACLLAAIFAPAAHAEIGAPQQDELAQNALATPRLRVYWNTLGNLPVARGIDEVAAVPTTQLARFEPHRTHDAYASAPLWLHLRVETDQASSAKSWTLGFDKTYVAQVSLFTRTSPQAEWYSETAGERIAHVQWPLQTLNPQFHLPAMNAGVHDFYLRVIHAVPIHFALNLQRSEDMQTHNQHQFLLVGLILGLIALMLVASVTMALVYRDTSYAWYALYAGVGLMTCASFVGFGSYALWPASTWWPELSTNVLLLLALVAQTQFCRVMFLSSGSKRAHYGITGVLWTCLAATGLYLLTDDLAVATVIFVAVAVVQVVTMLNIVARAMLQRNGLSWLWLVAYVPVLVMAALAVVDGWGWRALPWLPVNAPVYAVLFEMPVLLLALHLHAKTTHGQRVRSHTLAATDPLTGFLASHLFIDHLTQMWDKAQSDSRDLAVAYIEVTHTTHARLIDPNTAQRAVMRSVRLLRTVAREGDTIACIDPNLFALLMPGMPLGEALTSRLSRLVALGMMTDRDEAQAGSMRFRIIASTLRSFEAPWDELDDALRKRLRNPDGWGKRSLRFIQKQRWSVPDSTYDPSSGLSIPPRSVVGHVDHIHPVLH